MGLIEHSTNQLSYVTIGAAIEVHRHLGPGLLESSYHICLCRELELRDILYQSQVRLPIEYKGVRIEKVMLLTLPASSRHFRWSADELQRSRSPTRHQKNPALIQPPVQLPCLPCFRGAQLQSHSRIQRRPARCGFMLRRSG